MLKKLLVLPLLLLSLVGCKMDSISANETAVFNYNPYLFGRAYLDQTPYHGPYRAYYWFGTSMWTCNNVPHPIVVHADDFMSSDRVMLDFDVSILVGITDKDKCAEMLRAHGTTDPWKVFRRLVATESEINGKLVTTGEFLSYLREQVKHLHSAEFMAAQDEHGKPSDKAAAIEKDAKQYIENFLKVNNAGMIGVYNIALGRANPPDQVKKSMADTSSKAQDVKTQSEAFAYETKRRATEEEKAKADMAYMNGMKMSPEMYIQLKQIEACRAGATCVIGSGGQTPPPIVIAPTRQ